MKLHNQMDVEINKLKNENPRIQGRKRQVQMCLFIVSPTRHNRDTHLTNISCSFDHLKKLERLTETSGTNWKWNATIKRKLKSTSSESKLVNPKDETTRANMCLYHKVVAPRQLQPETEANTSSLKAIHEGCNKASSLIQDPHLLRWQPRRCKSVHCKPSRKEAIKRRHSSMLHHLQTRATLKRLSLKMWTAWKSLHQFPLACGPRLNENHFFVWRDYLRGNLRLRLRLLDELFNR